MKMIPKHHNHTMYINSRHLEVETKTLTVTRHQEDILNYFPIKKIELESTLSTT